MSRIDNKPAPTPKPQQASKPSMSNQSQKAGQESFASRFQKKTSSADKKDNTSSSSTTATSPDTRSSDRGLKLRGQSSSDASPSARMMQRHGTPVLGRRGGGSNTVADLQAQLDGQTTGKLDASLAGATGTGEAGGQQGQAGLMEMDGALKTDLDGNLALKNDAAGSAGLQMAGAGGQASVEGSATVQIQGGKIPTAMLDKIVDQARVGVNSAGAPEFQFDLKGDVLGGMKMRMSMDNGQLKAIFVAENPEVRKFIDGNLQDLRRSLEDRGIHIRDLEVRDPEEDRRQRQREQNQRDRQDSWDQS